MSHRIAARVDRVLIVLFAALPFSFVMRLPPHPGFWGQWACVAVALTWLALALPRARGMPLAAAALPGIGGILLVQSALGMVPIPTATLLHVVLLAIAALLAAAAGGVAADGRKHELADAFAWGLLLALILNAAIVAAGWMGYEVHLTRVYRVDTPPRAVGMIGQSNHLGVLAVIAFFAALHLHHSTRLPGWVAAGALALAALVCAATVSRIALVVWVVVFGFWMFWQRGLAGADGSRRLAVIGAVAFVAIQLAWVALQGQNHAGGEAALLDRPTAGRVEMLADAFALWQMHPLLGVGHGNYGAARLHELTTPAPTPSTDNAHNLVAQALVEWGLVGAAVVLAAAIYVLLLIARRLRDPQRSAAELLAGVWITAVLVHSMVEHPLWFAHFLLPFGLMLGLLPQRQLQRQTQPADGPAPRAATVAALAAIAGMMALVAWDYSRLQTLALKMLAELDRQTGTPALVSFADLVEVERLTFFPVQAKIMLSRKIPLGERAIDAKLELARQAMNAIPNYETVARYCAFAVVAGRDEEARAMLASFARRSPWQYARAHALISEWRAVDPRLAKLASDIAPVPAAGAPR